MVSNNNGVYLACSMIKAKKIDFPLLDFLEKWVQKQNYKPFTPGKMKDANPQDIFDRDLSMLEKSEIIIADVNEPSHGVGMEIMYGFIYDIPIICTLFPYLLREKVHLHLL